MRVALLSSIGWLGALQSWRPPGIGLDGAARLIATAGVLGTLTVLIYRLGVWRQEMENTKNNVGAHVHACLARIERRLDAIDHVASMAAEQRAWAARRQGRTERRLDRLEQSLEVERQ
jgi:hypothetical protein